MMKTIRRNWTKQKGGDLHYQRRISYSSNQVGQISHKHTWPLVFPNISLHVSKYTYGQWIIDTRATTNINLHNITTLVFPINVYLPNSQTIKATCIGSISLTDKITLHNVLQILDFHVNLLFVSQLTKDLHCSFTFHQDFCLIQDQLGNLIDGDERKNGLYILSLVDKFSRSSCPEVWHKTFGIKLGHTANLSQNKSIRHFQLLHLDVWRKSQIPTH